MAAFSPAFSPAFYIGALPTGVAPVLMWAREAVQNTSVVLTFGLRQTAAKDLALLGATVDVSLSVAGAAFSTIIRTVTEIGQGMYSVTLTTADTAILGDALIQLSADDADPSIVPLTVVVAVAEAVRAELSVELASILDTETKVDIATAILKNKTVTNPTTGVMTVYQTDGVTPMFTAQLYETVDGSVAYRGQGAERREALV